MNAHWRHEALRALWQGALILLGLLVVLVGGYAAIYQFSWASDPHWIEAHRDRFRLPDLAENLRWFWIHQDSQYWVVRVRLDRGPITLEGQPPHARYWSVTYYAGEQTNSSINNANVVLESDDMYRIVITADLQPGLPNQIETRPGETRATIELRITIQAFDQPVLLPDIWQNDTLLVEGVRP